MQPFMRGDTEIAYLSDSSGNRRRRREREALNLDAISRTCTCFQKKTGTWCTQTDMQRKRAYLICTCSRSFQACLHNAVYKSNSVYSMYDGFDSSAHTQDRVILFNTHTHTHTESRVNSLTHVLTLQSLFSVGAGHPARCWPRSVSLWMVHVSAVSVCSAHTRQKHTIL